MTTIIPSDTVAEINDMRQRVLSGEPVPQAELAACLKKYRTFREMKATTALVNKETAKAKKAQAALPADLLAALGELKI